MTDFTKRRLVQLYKESTYLLRKYEPKMTNIFKNKYNIKERLSQYRQLELRKAGSLIKLTVGE